MVDFRALILCVPVLLFGSTFVRADFTDCLNNLRSRAISSGVNQDLFDRTVQTLEPDASVPGFLETQPEFTTPVWDYLAALVDEERVTDGKALLKKHAQTLAKAQSRYNVDPAVVLAVWGVESDYGRSMGKRSIVQSLATLSCEGRRQNYFAGEFIAALKILDGGDIQPPELFGSWAGAFGQTQFMPSVFLSTAVDLDDDGRRDVVHSIPDALGSTANYLKVHGWTPGLIWGFEVKIPDGYDGPSGRRNKQPMSSWAARGIVRVDGKKLGDGKAGLILPAGPQGPAFLVTTNFDTIFSYNAAESYALAIAHLADRLQGGNPFVTPWPTDDLGLARIQRRELQTLLTQRGYDIGNADGVIGTKTRQAIVQEQTRLGFATDGHPGQRILQALREGQ